jgi:hypothetical protein
MTDCAAPNVDLRQSHELVAVGARLYHFPQREVHPSIAIDQQSVERLAALQLDEHGVTGRGRQEA